MSEAIPTPTMIVCAMCGDQVNALKSFGVSVPLNSKVKASDLCSVGCLMDWTIDQYENDDGEGAEIIPYDFGEPS